MASAPAPVSSASLYVGDLDREVTEAQLYEIFSQVGPVASIRVCRDAVTRRSLGYAYVNYNSTLDEGAAERALEALNYQVVNGRAMRIMWSHRDPSARRSGVGNIFIKNLDEEIDNKALHDTFSAFGNILSCKIAMGDGKSKGYGFVHFETQEGADLAIEKVNGMLLEGKKVYVGKFLKKSERSTDQTQQIFTNVFVKNLDTEVEEEELHTKFSEVGNISNLVIMRDDAGKSKGFGFVNFDNPESAQAAVENLNNTMLGAKTIYVGRAQKKSEREAMLRQQFEEKRQEQLQKYQGVNLYVKNIDDTVDEDKLKEEFSTFGNITSAKIMKDEKGQSKGFGFVCFSTPEEATKAVTEANGRMVAGKPIYAALAQRKEIRRQQLEQQYAMRIPTGMAAPLGAPAIRPGVPAPPAMYPPAGAPIFYTGPPGVMAGPGPQRQGMMYQQPMMPRSWRPGPMPPAMRPGFQPVPGYGQQVPVNARGQRQNRQRPNGQQAQQQGNPQQSGQAPPPAVQPLPGQQPPMQVSVKDVPRTQQRNNNQRQQYKYVPNGRVVANGVPPQVVPGIPQANGVPVTVPVVGPGAVPVTPIASGAVAAPMMPSGPQDALNPTMLAQAPPVLQKQMLGERLFPLIARSQGELSGKITGMLLEMDNSELLLLLDSEEALDQKIEEALLVLRQHGQAGPNASPPAMESAEALNGPALVEAR